MRAIHKERTGGTNRHPSITEILYVGNNVYGKRGGTSGNPVDAVEVARNTAACQLISSPLSDDTLIKLAGIFDGYIELKHMKKHPAVFTDELTAQVVIHSGLSKGVDNETL